MRIQARTVTGATQRPWEAAQPQCDVLGNGWRAAQPVEAEVDPDLATCSLDEVDEAATCWLDEASSGPAVLDPGVELALGVAGFPEDRLDELLGLALVPQAEDAPTVPSGDLAPGTGRARPLDGGRTPAALGLASGAGASLDAVVAAAEQTWLSRLVRAEVSPDDVELAIALAEAVGEARAAGFLRWARFAARQQAVLDALSVTRSDRYRRDDRGTYCNVYAHDVAGLEGAEIPRTWWRDDERVCGDPPDSEAKWDPSHAQEVTAGGSAAEGDVCYVNTLRLAPWFEQVGPGFGWVKLSGPEEAQRAADAGQLAIVVAAPKGGGHGHITVVLAEVPGQEAPRDDQGRLIGIRESQAGATNRRSFPERFAGQGAKPWWTKEDLRDASFWAHEEPDAWTAVERLRADGADVTVAATARPRAPTPP